MDSFYVNRCPCGLQHGFFTTYPIYFIIISHGNKITRVHISKICANYCQGNPAIPPVAYSGQLYQILTMMRRLYRMYRTPNQNRSRAVGKSNEPSMGPAQDANPFWYIGRHHKTQTHQPG